LTEHITPIAHSSLVGGSTASRRNSRRPVEKLTVDDVRRFLHYDPETGRLWWKLRSYDTFYGDKKIQIDRGKVWNQRFAGRRAFTSKSLGYFVGTVTGCKVYAHRIAWIHYYGEMPAEGRLIDHINGDKTDNRISNLRLVTRQQNIHNKPGRGGTSRHKGVQWSKTARKWVAVLRHEGKNRHLGFFNSEEDAAARYIQEADMLHGEYAYHNSAGKGTA
jgi:hypothetical protein